MPKASDHQSSTITKLLLIGDSGTGKTTALWSLVRDGYRLRILDFDGLLAPLIAKVRRECPENLDHIEFISLRDKMKSTPMGPVINGQPRAYIDSMKYLDQWEDGSKPSEWGPNTIVVVDSLTTWARSAYWWAKGMQGAANFAEGVPLKGVRPEQFYHTAQQALINSIDYLTADWFETNVIVLAHIKHLERDGVLKGFPMNIGNAICEEIPGRFACYAQASKTLGTTPRRMLRTSSTNTLDLKNPKFFDTADEYPLETGLSDYFKAQRS